MADDLNRFKLQGGSIRVFNPKVTAAQLRKNNINASEWFGLCNTFNFNVRGPKSSHGFFLVQRSDIDRYLDTARTKSYHHQSISLEITNYDNSTTTIGDLRAINAYSVTGSLKPNSITLTRGIEDTEPTDDSLADANKLAWYNQLYVLHVVDGRYDVLKGGGPAAIRYKPTSPYDTDYGESYGVTNYSHVFSFAGASPNVSNADFPTTFDNINYQHSPNPWNNYDLAEYLHHTVVRQFSGLNYVYAKGNTSDTTTATERENKKSRLLSISNDISFVAIPNTVYVDFPTSYGQWHRWNGSSAGATKSIFTQPDIITLDKHHSVSVDVTTLSSSDLGIDSTLSSSDVSAHGGHRISGRLLAQYDRDALGDAPSNLSTLETHAEELTKLYLRSKIHNTTLFKEIYSGFTEFTPTHQLSSITYLDDGYGKTTTIRNESFDLDMGEDLASPYRNRKTIPLGLPSREEVASTEQTSLFYNHRQTLVKITSCILANASGDAELAYATGSSTLSMSSVAPSSGYEVKIWNTTDVPLVPNSVVTAYWNTQIKGWVVTAKPKTYAGQASGSISARSGSTLGTGTVNLYYIDSSGAWTTTGASVPVYNIAASATALNAYVTIKRLAGSDKWVLDMEDCA